MTSTPPSAGLQDRGTELPDGVEDFEDTYRPCHVPGPVGNIVMLADRMD